MKTDDYKTILDSIADGVFTVDRNWFITSFNKSAEKITGISKEQAIGQKCWEVFRASICENNCALKNTMKSGKQCVNNSLFIVNSKGKRIPISISTALLKSKDGNIVGGVETFRDLSTLEELKKELLGRSKISDIVTKNHKLLSTLDTIPTIAKSDSTVLIEGESGTGKELMARAIHRNSNRKNGPFITVNCAALPDTLLESELFGYKKGAFTDAKKDKPGRFQLASGGTIFLDEIGDISPALQVKLLRVLQEKTFEPLGAIAPETSNARVVVATNRDLPKLVEEEAFRLDLYYRINVLQVHIPPLRERREDIPLLTTYFLDHCAAVQEKERKYLSNEAMALIVEHDFPGNVRELENIIEHACIMCPDNLIEISHLPNNLKTKKKKTYSESNMSVEDFEKQRIKNALEKNKYNKKKTAQALGIHKTTLWRKMKALGISDDE